MKMIITLLIVVLFLTLTAFSQSFQDYKKQEQQNFQQYKESEQKAFAAYKKQEQEGIEKLRKEIEAYWGQNGFVTSTNKDWVEYSTDKQSRSDVDFKNGKATVQVLLSEKEASNPKLVRKKLEDAVEKLALTKGKTRDFSTPAERPKALESVPVLKGQLQTKEGKVVNASNVKQYAKEEVTPGVIQKEIVKGTDGVQRTKFTINLNLAPDYIKIRAAIYQTDIAKYAHARKLPSDLLFAVIHTESFFNPKATSSAPAFGLMQLVPSSGALDAYRFLYNRGRLITANFLFNPDNNIKLGSAYLQLLMSRYFSRVKDPDSRILCAVAAYNTGPGNVARAFTGSTDPGQAIPYINKMTYHELYKFLSRHLPYEETRNYIAKVTQRMVMYHNWKLGK
ncbi:MAG: DUF3393 domain-containing protein [Bacteroidales bacterium]|nr:DUF3393 domain-containing protein [Bacteroidales bacterium]